MNYSEALEKLQQIRQEHLLKYWPILTDEQQQELLKQIAHLDLALFQRQQEALVFASSPFQKIEPFLEYASLGSKANRDLGAKLIHEGVMGCLLIAGGQGSRLRLEGPKGMFPISIIKRKSLFQIYAEKVLAASHWAGRELPLAVMTSPQNHQQTVEFFEAHQWFGLKKHQLYFFMQDQWPMLDLKGNLFLETPSKIAQGPNGNGEALYRFYQAGIWQDWYQKGVRYLNVVLVDNPLADPYDSELLGFAHCSQSDIVIKCTQRSHPHEKVGVIVRVDGRPAVIEYTEMPIAEKERCHADGSPVHICANLSLFCLEMQFVKRVAMHSEQLPLHVAKKSVKFLDVTGRTVLAEQPSMWKFEKFIFDVLSYATHAKALLYPRECCFAPLKQLEGEGGVVSVQSALQAQDRRTWQALTGIEPPLNQPFELAQDFYYPTHRLLREWQGKSLPNKTYVEP